MAGKKETTKRTTVAAAKKPKIQESEVVSDEIDDAVVSDSEESESSQMSLNSELQTEIEKSRKIEANQSIIGSKKGVEFEKSNNKIKEIDTITVSGSESEDEEAEDEEDEVEESEAEEVEKSEGEEEEEEEESEGEEVEESEGEKEENVKKIKKIEKNNGGVKLKGKVNGKMSDSKPNGKWKGKEIEKNESESGSGLYKLPMRRISRIIKDGSPDMRITQEATFLINKATEKFLELLAREAYVCAFLDKKNQVAYNHLSSGIAKRGRLDFLSDFVPEKVKAEVVLPNLSMNEK